ncbi:hypothetical protein EPN87_04215 [archaeon]|nr:MAG: hypothetical protein EPN87_04215 [archaeon]
MRFSEVRELLDELKGEDSVFKLLETKEWAISELYSLFINTKVKDVARLQEFLSNLKGDESRTISVGGERGVGKSTLVSTALLDNYSDGKIDQINYIRYNVTDGNFKELFKISRTNPKSRVIVIDDILYFMPDWATGRVSNFIRTLDSITKMYYERSPTLLIYVTDTWSPDVFYTICDGVARVAGRQDLLQNLPRPPISKKVHNPHEINIDSEFFGRTYSITEGDYQYYDIAKAFGDVMRSTKGLLATNPRLLRFLINKVGQIYYNGKDAYDPVLFVNDEVLRKFLTHELESKDDVKQFIRNTTNRIREDFSTNMKYLLGQLNPAYNGLSSIPSPDDIEKYDTKFYLNRMASISSGMHKDSEKIEQISGDLKLTTNSYRQKFEHQRHMLVTWEKIPDRKLAKIRDGYSFTEMNAQSFVSQNPLLFTNESYGPVKELLENPHKAIGKLIEKRVNAGLPVY